MSDHVYKSLELTGSSTSSIEEAVNNALKKAAETIHDLRWVEVTDIRGEVQEGTVAFWQVTAKVGFKLDD